MDKWSIDLEVSKVFACARDVYVLMIYFKVTRCATNNKKEDVFFEI